MTAEATFRAELIRPVHELLAGHASRQPDRIAFKDTRRAVTWAELDRRTARVAGHLVELGLARGASAVIYLPNRVETVESYLAVTRAAAVGVPLDPGSTDAELAHLLEDCAAELVVTGAAQLPQVRRVLADRPGTVVVLVGEDGEPGFTEAAGLAEGADAVLPRWEELASSWSLRHPPRDDLGLDEPAWLLYTSGTTGRPRGVVCTQRTSLWATAACNAPLLGLSPRDRVLWPMSLFHAVAHNVCVLGAVAVGATVCLTDGPDADEVLRRAADEDATFLVGVPTLYHQMVEPARSGALAVPRLRVCMVVGSSCPPSLHEAFRSALGLALLDSYGSTETGGAITTNLPQGPYVPGSCGVPLPGVTLRLTDPRTGEEVERGAEGEVWVSSPALMLGYHRQPEETARVLSGGWYRTGDLARQDSDGYVTITGRLKELIIRGGENIHPREVERVLVEAPGVADAAVAGVPHGTLGEVPVAYVVPAAGGLDVEAVLSACRRRLSAFKLPEEIHEVTEVPRNPGGKIARKLLAGLPTRTLWRRPPQGPGSSPRSSAAVGLGLDDGGHPLLSAVVELPGRDELVCTGRVTATGDDPTLAQRVDGTVVLAGAALLDLVLHAAGRAGCAKALDVTADEPLVLPRHGGVQLRVTVGVPEADGVRRVTVHGRRDEYGAARRPWTRYATATVAPAPVAEPVAEPAADRSVWPPRGATPVTGRNNAGRPEAARTPRGVWRRGDEVFVEVALPDWVTGQDRHALHPALPDAALAGALGLARGAAPAGAGPVAAVRWRDVTLHATGACALRVRLRETPDGSWELEASDGAGDPVLSARSVSCAPLRSDAVRSASAAQQDALFEESWEPYALPRSAVRAHRWAVVGPDAPRVRAALSSAGRPGEAYPDPVALLSAVEEGAPVPDVVVVSPTARDGADPADAVRAAVGEALMWIRHFADPRLARTRLAVVTHDAVVTDDGRLPDAGAAAVRGLVGAAQDRAPGRFVLLDTDAGPDSWRRVEDAVASGEPRLALRDGRALVPRGVRVPAGPVPALAPGRTALFAGVETEGPAEALLVRAGGGTGQGAAGPLLTGPFAKSVADRLGPCAAAPELLRWDPVDPAGTVRALLDGAPRTVLFTAAVRADGPTADARADVDAALHPVLGPALELVRSAPGRDLDRVVFATPAPAVAGLADAAVAAVFDVWARALRRAGVPAVSLRGPEGGTDEATNLFAAAVAAGRASLTAQRPDLRVPHGGGPLTATAALLRDAAGGLARRTARDAAAGPGGLRRRLAVLTSAEQEEVLLRLVRDRFASVLGLASTGQVPGEAEARDLGFDSLTALSARNALESATGLSLPASVVFDSATPAGLARHLRGALLADGDG
ncbi:AMP-binding protein [Streptomyces pseudogriseolus]|uniref:AMP-binding protein n=1 Tax=Streptomyces pseudogriseolus TaxID=36817 RepID=UPI00349A9393